MSRSHQLALCCLTFLAFSLPFETGITGLAPAGFLFTNLELLLAIVLLLTLMIMVRERRWQKQGWLNIPAGWLLLWGWFIVAALFSALFAPTYSFNALKATIRTLNGLALTMATVQLLPRPEQQRWVIGGLLLGSSLSVAIGLVEMFAHQRFDWLTIFREIPTSVGPFDRLSAAFDHANQAGAYFAATLPLLAAAGWSLFKGKSRPRFWLLASLTLLALLFYLQAVLFSYSRTSLVTIFLSNGFVVAFLWPKNNHWPWLATIGLLVASFALHLLFNPAIRLRLVSEDDRQWYNLSFTIPEHLTLPAGQITPVTISIRNDSPLTWSSRSSNPVNIGGHWLLNNGNLRLSAEPRWALPELVSPGETISLTIQVLAPLEAGDYQLEWDMVQENVLWFSFKNHTHSISQVQVVESDAVQLILPQETTLALSSTMAHVEVPAAIPGRTILWRIAFNQFRQHPLFGIGLDNFRLTYGQALGLQSWNTTIHTNNWYIETLVSLGLFGAVPFFIWLAALLLTIFRDLLRPGLNLWSAAITVSLFTYLFHGLLDYFLLFNPNGFLFWLLIGLWLVTRRHESPANNGQPLISNE